MTTSFVVEIGKESIITCFMVVAPVMIVGFVLGMTVSIVQAIMQIQEMTLAYVPKLVGIAISLVVCGHWMLEKLMSYTTKLFTGFHGLTQM